jgi:pullulanase
MVVALLLEQQGGDGAVHSAGQGDEDFFLGWHGFNDAGAGGFVKLGANAPCARHVACLLHRVSPRNFTVPMQQDLPVRAWLESPVSGCIEYPVDWNDTEVPAVRLSGPGGVRVLASFDRAPRHAAALRYGYFVNDDGEMVFAVSPTVTNEAAVYVAGDFNDWQQAVGMEEWRLQPGELEGVPMLLWTGPAVRFIGGTPPRFKFVTAEHQWLPLPDNAPNAVGDTAGHLNLVVDPRITGRQLFRFTLPAPLDLSVAWTVAPAGAEAKGVPLEPGEFFFTLRTDLPLGALVRAGQTVFRLFAPRARAVRLRLASAVKAVAAAEPLELVRRADETAVWELALEGSLHGWFYWYELDGPRDRTARFDPAQRVLDPYALATVNHQGPAIVLDRAWVGRGDRQFCHAGVAGSGDRGGARARPRGARTGGGRRAGAAGVHRPAPVGRESGVLPEPARRELRRAAAGAGVRQPRAREEYHWGYMPANWFAPASAFSLDAGGGLGVRELQALVAAFHQRGMAVVLDVVYNHVGEPAHLLFIDKLYYFEQDAGASSRTGAGAATTCARAAMMRG